MGRAGGGDGGRNTIAYRGSNLDHHDSLHISLQISDCFIFSLNVLFVFLLTQKQLLTPNLTGSESLA